ECAGSGYSEPLSARRASEHIQSRYMLRLKGAPFKTDDAELVPDAGPCTVCPHRTGNQLEIFEDVGSADVCTLPACFEAKSDAAWKAKADRYRKRGLEVLDGKKSEKIFYGALYGTSDRVRDGSGYVAVGDRPWEDPEGRTYGQLLGKTAATAVARAPSGKAIQLIPSKGLKKKLKDAGYDFEKLRREQMEQDRQERERELEEEAKKDPELAEQQRQWREQQRRRELRRKLEPLALGRIVEAAEKGVAVNRKDFWRHIALLLAGDDLMCTDIAERRGWRGEEGEDPDPEHVEVSIGNLTPEQCRGLIVEFLVGCAQSWSFRQQEDAVDRACELFQVDLEALEREVAAAAEGDGG
ncbi:MAG: hypothetical protein ACOC5B_04745, partial [Myxococcota bacterium]